MKAFQQHLQGIYGQVPGSEWVNKNGFVFEQAKLHGLALAGSISIAAAKGRTTKQPSDLDFVCASFGEAQAFINALERKLTEYKSHWRVYVNHGNDYVPPGAISHFRFQSAIWLPICVMVIPAEKFQCWFCTGGMRVQLFTFTKDAAAELSKVDQKARDLDDDDDVLNESLTPVRIELSDGMDELEKWVVFPFRAVTPNPIEPTKYNP